MIETARATPNSSRRKPASLSFPRPRLKILMTRVRLLYPLNTGGKIRTAKTLEQLSKDNDVTLVTYRYPEDTDKDVEMTSRLCRQLITVPFSEAPKNSPRFFWELAKNLVEPLPYVVSKYSSKDMARTVETLYHALHPDLVMVDFLQACETLRNIKNVPFVLFQHNVEASIFEQLAQRADTFLKRQYLMMQARRMRAYEKKQCRRAHRVIAVSDMDRLAYQRDYGVTHTDVVPTGVDTGFFTPSIHECRVNNLVFTGSMDWMANQDAIEWFVNEIFPLIRAEIPDVVFSVVGRNPTPQICKLGEQPGIHVTGTVNDVRPYVRGSKVYVVPLRIGSGTRLKLLEAMAMGKAIVSTSIGAEGLPVQHGKNIILADTPRKFADETVALLRENQRRSEMQKQARQLVERDYSWPQVGRVFNDICYRAATEILQSRA